MQTGGLTPALVSSEIRFQSKQRDTEQQLTSSLPGHHTSGL